jgi:hypothetical protein
VILTEKAAELIALAKSTKLSQLDINMIAETYQQAMGYRLSLDKQSAAAKKVEDSAKEALITQLRAGAAPSAVATAVSIELGPVEYVPHVMDWDAFYAYVHANNDFSLLERRPGRSAHQTLWDAGVTVPGVEKYPVYKLSVTKLKGKA